MPEVKTFSNVRTTQEALPGVEVKGYTTPDTFGAGFGKNISEASDLGMKIYERQSEIRTRENMIKYRNEVAKLKQDYEQNGRGSNALDYQKDVKKRLSEINSRYSGELSGTENHKVQFQQFMQSETNSFELDNNRFVISEMDKYSDGVDTTAEKQFANDAARKLAEGKDFNPDFNLALNARRSRLARVGMTSNDAANPSAMEVASRTQILDTVINDAFEYTFADNPVQGVAFAEANLSRVSDMNIRTKMEAKIKAVKETSDIIGAVDHGFNAAVATKSEDENKLIYAGITAIDDLVRSKKLKFEDASKAKSDLTTRIKLLTKNKQEQSSANVDRYASAITRAINFESFVDGYQQMDDVKKDEVRLAAAKSYQIAMIAAKANLTTEEYAKFDAHVDRVSNGRMPDNGLLYSLSTLPIDKLRTLTITEYEAARLGKDGVKIIQSMVSDAREGKDPIGKNAFTLAEQMAEDVMISNGVTNYKPDRNGKVDAANRKKYETVVAVLSRNLNYDMRKQEPVYEKREQYVRIGSNVLKDDSPLVIEKSAPYHRANSNAAILNFTDFDPNSQEYADRLQVLNKWMVSEFSVHNANFTANAPYTEALTYLGASAGRGGFDLFGQNKLRREIAESGETNPAIVEETMINMLKLEAIENKKKKYNSTFIFPNPKAMESIERMAK